MRRSREDLLHRKEYADYYVLFSTGGSSTGAEKSEDIEMGGRNNNNNPGRKKVSPSSTINPGDKYVRRGSSFSERGENNMTQYVDNNDNIRMHAMNSMLKCQHVSQLVESRCTIVQFCRFLTTSPTC